MKNPHAVALGSYPAEIITTASERRQIARVLDFASHLARHIDWNTVAQDARELGAHWEVRTHKDHSMTITMFWSYTDGEL